MKKIHVLSFISTGILTYIALYFGSLFSFLNVHSPVNPLTSHIMDIYTIIPKHLHGLWKLYEKLGEHVALLVTICMILAVICIILFLASYEPADTFLIRTPVEMVTAIFVVALYLLSLVFRGLNSLSEDLWNLSAIAQITIYFLGILLLFKHLFAKVRLGIFRQSTLAGMLKKPSKKTVGDDVKDLKNTLGIDGLNAPWIKPII